MWLIIKFLFVITSSVRPLLNAHAHNDYQHTRPLQDALDYGFTSVEADVHLIDQQLYVYHDFPANPVEDRTLENLYLTPLLERIQRNNGSVYPGYDDPFLLMIDIKSESTATYQKLEELLIKYQNMLTIVKSGVEQVNGPVKVFVSGNRPIDKVLSSKVIYASLDGRPADLEHNIPANLMPVVSDNFHNFLSWNGSDEQQIDPGEMQRLQQFIKQAHQQGKKVRLWAAPDTPAYWKLALKLDIDLINSDRLQHLSEFLNNRLRGK